MSVGVDVSAMQVDMLQLRKKKRFVFKPDFACVFDLGLPSKLLPTVRATWRCSITVSIV